MQRDVHLKKIGHSVILNSNNNFSFAELWGDIVLGLQTEDLVPTSLVKNYTWTRFLTVLKSFIRAFVSAALATEGP